MIVNLRNQLYAPKWEQEEEKKIIPPKYSSCATFPEGLLGISVLMFRAEDKSNETTDDSIRGWKKREATRRPSIKLVVVRLSEGTALNVQSNFASIDINNATFY
jgi:hypothetical protein